MAADLSRLRNGPRPQEISAVESELRLDQAELELAQRNYQRTESLFGKQAADKTDLDEAQTKLRVAQAAVDARTERLALLKEGTRQEDLVRGEAILKEAEQQLALYNNGYRVEDIQEAQAKRDAADAALRAIERQITELRIVSPCRAVVEALELRPGDLLAANVAAVSLIDTERCSELGYIDNSRLIVCGKPEQLKLLPEVTPPGTTRWELDLPHPTPGTFSAAEPFSVEPSFSGSASPLNRNPFQPPAGLRSMAGFVAVFLKEFAHIRREPTTLFFSFFVPVLQSIVFGFAINTEIKNIPMVVLDLDGRREARELRDAFENTHTFRITERVLRDEDFDHALRSGKAKVGLRIPANYSDLLLLLTLSLLFLLCALGLGLLVSALAKTQLHAIQFAFIIMLPSVLLSGFMFPRSEMPGPIYLATFAIPVTYYLEILRAIVLRGAGLADIIPSVVGLIVSTAAILGLSLSRFRKQLG